MPFWNKNKGGKKGNRKTQNAAVLATLVGGPLAGAAVALGSKLGRGSKGSPKPSGISGGSHGISYAPTSRSLSKSGIGEYMRNERQRSEAQQGSSETRRRAQIQKNQQLQREGFTSSAATPAAAAADTRGNLLPMIQSVVDLYSEGMDDAQKKKLLDAVYAIEGVTQPKQAQMKGSGTAEDPYNVDTVDPFKGGGGFGGALFASLLRGPPMYNLRPYQNYRPRARNPLV